MLMSLMFIVKSEEQLVIDGVMSMNEILLASFSLFLTHL